MTLNTEQNSHPFHLTRQVVMKKASATHENNTMFLIFQKKNFNLNQESNPGPVQTSTPYVSNLIYIRYLMKFTKRKVSVLLYSRILI